MAKRKTRRRRPPAADDRAAREADKRARREERKRLETSARRRARRRRRVRTWAITAVVLGGLGFGAYLLFRPLPEVEGVEKPPNRGRDHVRGATYDDPAPTSGAHDPTPANCGAYREQPPLAQVVHSMEHGAVVLWYRPDAEQEVRPRLLELMEPYDSHVIVAPNPRIEEKVVATAWNRRLRFDDVDDPRLAEFVQTYRNRGPERVDCPILTRR